MKQIASRFAPPPKISISEWAEKTIHIENSSRPGKWKRDFAPYQGKILDAVGNPKVKRITAMMAAQLGKTLMQAIIMGYFMDYDASPSLIVFPTDSDVKTFCKQKLYPFVNNNPDLIALTGILGGAGKQKNNNTMDYIEFPGGFLALVGSQSPNGLAMRSCRFLMLDEVDRFSYSAGEDGDPLILARKRQASFWNAKEFMTSTPLLKDTSRVYQDYLEGTQSQWCLPCPECGEFNDLDFWRLNLQATDLLDMATLACKHCGTFNDEDAWRKHEEHGDFVAAYPEQEGHFSFHVNTLASPFIRWEKTVEAWLDVKEKGPVQVQTFWNLELGLPYEQVGDVVDDTVLLNRVEDYPAQCPRGTLVLTAGVDIQKDRVELKVKGYGIGEESWLVDYQVFWGDPVHNEVLHDAEAYLDGKFYEHEFGHLLKVQASCWDTGYLSGHITAFLKGKNIQRKWAIKGATKMDAPFISSPSMKKGVRKNDRKSALYTIGVGEGKKIVYSRLLITEVGPQYMHFNKKIADASYFRQLTAEKLITKYEKHKRKEEWIVIRNDRRNEALDTEVYALAALRIYNPNIAELHKRHMLAEKAYLERTKKTAGLKRLFKNPSLPVTTSDIDAIVKEMAEPTAPPETKPVVRAKRPVKRATTYQPSTWV